MAADFGHGGIGVLVTPGGVTGMRPATLDAEIAGVALVRAMRDAAAMDQQVHVRVVAGNVEDRRVTRFLQHQRVRRISDGPALEQDADTPAERADLDGMVGSRSEEHTSELQSLMRNSYAVF